MNDPLTSPETGLQVKLSSALRVGDARAVIIITSLPFFFPCAGY